MSLWCKESGEEHPQTILFLHGLLASAQNWQVISKRLSKQYHTVCIDLPNHGHSLHSEKADYEFMLSELISFIEEKGYENFHLVGHSLGGKVAMLYALSHPEKIKKLVVEDIAPKVYPMRFTPIMQAMHELDLTRYTSRREIDEALSSKIPDKAIRLFVMTNLDKKTEGFRWRVNLKSLLNSADKLMSFPAEKKSYEQSCLFLCGRQSDYVSELDEPVIREYFNACEINYIEGAGHWLHAEKPDDFCLQLISFFNK